MNYELDYHKCSIVRQFLTLKPSIENLHFGIFVSISIRNIWQPRRLYKTNRKSSWKIKTRYPNISMYRLHIYVWLIHHFNQNFTAEMYHTWLYVKCKMIYDHICTQFWRSVSASGHGNTILDLLPRPTRIRIRPGQCTRLLNTILLVLNKRTSNIERNRAFTRFSKLLIEQARTSFFRTLNELEPVHILVIERKQPIFGIERLNPSLKIFQHLLNTKAW